MNTDQSEEDRRKELLEVGKREFLKKLRNKKQDPKPVEIRLEKEITEKAIKDTNGDRNKHSKKIDVVNIDDATSFQPIDPISSKNTLSELSINERPFPRDTNGESESSKPTITTPIINSTTSSTITRPPVINRDSVMKSYPTVIPEENRPSRDTLQLHVSISDAMKKVKILEETNKVMVTEKISMSNQLRDFEEKFHQQKMYIAELNQQIKRFDEEKSREVEKNKQLHREIQELKEKHARELLPVKEKDVMIKKLTTDLSELREKYTTESRSQQQTIISQITNFETLQLEKTNLEKDKDRLFKEKSELTSQINQLQKQLHQLSEEKVRLESKIDTEHKKNRQLESHVTPLEKKLQERELMIQQMNLQYSRENEEKISHIRKLETEVKSLLDEREFLSVKVNSGEKAMHEKIDQMRKESSELTEKYLSQCKTIERLMLQKRNIMFQLANEVKRNGMLVKENSEIRQAILVQQQILTNLGISPPSTTAIEQNGLHLPKIEMENRDLEPNIVRETNSDPNTINVSTSPKGEPPLINRSSDLSDVVVVNSGSWLSSVPIFGRILSPPKTFRKKFEVIV